MQRQSLGIIYSRLVKSYHWVFEDNLVEIPDIRRCFLSCPLYTKKSIMSNHLGFANHARSL